MTTIIEQAREMWEAKREKMTKEDWMLLADALIEGKVWCAEHKGYGGPKGFGKWCLENGFGSVDRRDRTDAMKVAEDYRKEYLLTDYTSIINPHAFMAAIRKQREIDINGHLLGDAVGWVWRNPGATAEEIAEGLGVDKEFIRKRTSSWVSRGVLTKEKDEEGTIRFKVGEGTPKPKARTVEDRLAVDAAHAGHPVETFLAREVAEKMYWLNNMIAKRLNDGTIMLPQVDLDTQSKRFEEWLDSFFSVSGRSGVITEKVDGELIIRCNPYNSAPLRLEFKMRSGDED